MKNPFSPAEQVRFEFWMQQQTKFTPEQAKYAYNAINQHDKLVAMLRELATTSQLAYTTELGCPWCDRTEGMGHKPDCALASLLAEEEK